MEAANSLALEMGYTEAEFAHTLPGAMRDWSVSGGPRDWRVEDTDGAGIADIRIRPLLERRLGALKLPVLAVEIRVDKSSSAVAAEFKLRFERGFHKGGG